MSEIVTILGVDVPASVVEKTLQYQHGYGYRYYQNVIALGIRLEQGEPIRCAASAVRELWYTRHMDLSWGQADWRMANPWFDQLLIACIKHCKALQE